MLKTKQHDAPTAARGAGQDAEVPTPQRIREAAIGPFAEEGYAATGIRDIGRRAGISTSVLYHYVSNREQLLAGIMLDGLTNLLSVGPRAVDAVFGIVRVDDDGTPLRVAITTLDIGALIRELDSTPRVTFEGDLAPGTPK